MPTPLEALEGASQDNLMDLASAAGDQSVVGAYDEPTKAVNISWRDGESWAMRAVVTASNGDLVLVNLSQRLVGFPKGEGTRRLARQVQACWHFGIKRILTTASGEPGNWMNGYYTWPRLGFDGRITDGPWRKMPEELRLVCGQERSAMALCQTGPGAEWWRANGKTLDVWFDTDVQSVSNDILARRLAKLGPL